MNLVFFSILDAIKSYFGENPLPSILEEEFDSNFIIQGIINLQKAIEGLSGQDSIAAAHVVLLAAGVTIFLGVAGEAFFKKGDYYQAEQYFQDAIDLTAELAGIKGTPTLVQMKRSNVSLLDLLLQQVQMMLRGANGQVLMYRFK